MPWNDTYPMPYNPDIHHRRSIRLGNGAMADKLSPITPGVIFSTLSRLFQGCQNSSFALQSTSNKKTLSRKNQFRGG
jgi:hypothetical protein